MTHGREFHFAVGDRLRAINLAYNRLTRICLQRENDGILKHTVERVIFVVLNFHYFRSG